LWKSVESGGNCEALTYYKIIYSATNFRNCCRSAQRFPTLDASELELVSLVFGSWNRIGEWLRRIDRLRKAA
jgi:hypothetical protein